MTKTLNVQQVIDNVDKLLEKKYLAPWNIEAVYNQLNIFDWFKDKLSVTDLKKMRAFLKQAQKLGFGAYVDFKVGVSGCANGMWAYKEPSTTGYSPDGDHLYRSFTPDYTEWAFYKEYPVLQQGEIAIQADNFAEFKRRYLAEIGGDKS